MCRGGISMDPIKNMLLKICNDKKLIEKFKKIKNLEEFYEFCRKIDPSMNISEVDKSIKDFILKENKQQNCEMDDKELEMVAGGVLNFDKFKASAIMALVALGALGGNSLFFNSSASAVSPVTGATAQVKEGNRELLNKKLAKAIADKDFETCKKLLNEGADINTKDARGNTALIAACSVSNSESFVDFLLEKGANPNAINYENFYRTPLILAAKNRSETNIKKLIEKGADINKKDRIGTALIEVCKEPKMKNSFDLLIEKGADVNITGEAGNYSALTMAVESKNQYAVKILIQKGADVNVRGTASRTPIMFAATDPNGKDMIKFLAQNGANVNYKNSNQETALSLALKNDLIENIKALVECSADINEKDALGETLLSRVASQRGGEDIFEFLVKNGADVHAESKYGGSPIRNAMSNSLEKVVILLENGLGINERYAGGKNLLYYLNTPKIKNHKQVLDYLIEKGIDVNCVSSDENESTPIEAAVNVGDDYAVKKLLENGADVNLLKNNILFKCIDNYKNSISHPNFHDLDAKNRHLNIFKILAEKNICVNTLNKDGDNPLIYAINNHVPELAEILCEKTKDLNLKNNKGQTAVLSAVANSDLGTLRKLVELKADINETDNEGKNAAIIATCKYNYETPDTVEVFKLVLDSGADVNMKDKKGNTPLDYTIMTQNTTNRRIMDPIRLLVKKGANDSVINNALLNLKDHPKVYNPLTTHLLNNIKKFMFLNIKDDSIKKEKIWSDDIELVKFAIRSGADVNVKNEDGCTPLMMAITKGNEHADKIIRLLLAFGADVNKKDNKGETALMKTNSSEKLIKLLISSGADINAKDNHGYTALMKATKECKTEKLEYLLKHNPNLEIKDNEGNTALLLAMDKGYTNPARALLSAGANVEIRDGKNNTALIRAVRANAGHSADMVRLLAYYNANAEATNDEGKKAIDYAKHDDVINALKYYKKKTC